MWHLYIIECENGALYTGIALDVQKRFLEHVAGKGSKYLRANKPVSIIYKKKYATRSLASKKEAQIKALSTKQKKDLIYKIRGKA